MADKGARARFVEREIRMVLVGKTGSGKSETGNTICGARIFKSLLSPVSVTKKCKQYSFQRFGQDLQLVDVPGICDTHRSDDDIQREMMKCVAMSSPGIHAILFIERLGRFTDEDQTTLEKFLQYFGKEAVKFVIPVFTGKDDLEASDRTFEEFISDGPVKLKTFLFDAKSRHIAVNNRGTDAEKEKFTKKLIDMIKIMVAKNGGQCYTDEMYERCEADLQKAEKKEKLDEKRQKEIEDKLKQEADALAERRLQMQRDEEHLMERLKSLQMRKEDEERKQEAKLKESQESIRIELAGMKASLGKEMEEFEIRKEELRLKEIRKQIREKVEEGNLGLIRTTWQSVKNIASTLW